MIKPGMKVKVLPLPNSLLKFAIGQTYTVLEPSKFDNYWHLEGIKYRGGKRLHFHEKRLEPIDEDYEKGSWDAIEKLTGWIPLKERVS